jgi:hypothetical protein
LHFPRELIIGELGWFLYALEIATEIQIIFDEVAEYDEED